MTQRVVDVLEAVEVEKHQRDLAAAAVGTRDRLSDAVRQQRAVGQAGQRVMVCHVHDALVGATTLLDLRLESGIRPRQFDGPLLDPSFECGLRVA